MIANTPKPPYYTVIFTSVRTNKKEGYEKMAKRMVELAEKQPGFLDVDSARNKIGITVSYWRDLESIEKWKHNAEHLKAQELGKTIWYKEFKVRICRIDNDYRSH